MNKDKHVMPDDRDTLRDRIEREAESKGKRCSTRIIYGPDNEPISRVYIYR